MKCTLMFVGLAVLLGVCQAGTLSQDIRGKIAAALGDKGHLAKLKRGSLANAVLKRQGPHPECEGSDCPPPPECEGSDCPPPPECEGSDCPPPPECEGSDCPPPPEGFGSDQGGNEGDWLGPALVFGALYSDCGIYYNIIDYIVTEYENEFTAEDVMHYFNETYNVKALNIVCPCADELGNVLGEVDDATKMEIAQALQPHMLVLGCVSHFTAIEYKNITGYYDGSEETQEEMDAYMPYGAITWACLHRFGEEFVELNEALDTIKEAVVAGGRDCGFGYKRSSDVRSLLKQLEQLLRSKK